MKLFLVCVVMLAMGLSTSDARLTIRHRRQVEREGSSSSDSGLPPSEVVVIKDTVNPSLPGPLFLVPRLPGPGDAFDLDINEQDGTFTFGGQLPSFAHHHHHHHGSRMDPSGAAAAGHQSFASIFDQIQRRFDEMTRNMMSFNNFGPGFSPTKDISSLPDDYNNTESEIVELGGQRYVKKTTTLKKGSPGATFFVRSTTFEKVNENENADIPAPGAEEVDKKEKPAVIGGGSDENGEKDDGPKAEESSPSNTTTSTSDPKDSAQDPPAVADDESSGNGPKNNPDTPDDAVVPSSSETPIVSESSDGSPPAVADPAAAAVPADETPAVPDAAPAGTSDPDAKDKDNSSDEREREGESIPSSSSTTEQP